MDGNPEYGLAFIRGRMQWLTEMIEKQKSGENKTEEIKPEEKQYPVWLRDRDAAKDDVDNGPSSEMDMDIEPEP